MKKSAQNKKIVKISLPSYIAGICFLDATRFIRALKPLGVYRDRVNVAVITRTNAHVERGVYFYTWFSSYYPMDEPGRKFRWNKKASHLDYVFTK